MLKNIFGNSKNREKSESSNGIDYSNEYSDIRGWKFEIDTSTIDKFSIIEFPNNLNFYLENWSHNLIERTSKKLEVLPGRTLEFWTLPTYSNRISTDVIDVFKKVFKQTQTNRGDSGNYWERITEIEITILEKYLNDIKEFVYLFDYSNYGYQMIQIQSKYETTSLRGASGYDAYWGTQHTFDKENEKREFIKFETTENGNKKIEWIPIKDRKLYLFDNPKTNEKEGFLIRKLYPEEVQIHQYDRLTELFRIARRHKLPITVRFNQM